MGRPPRFSPATQLVLQRFASAPLQWLHGYTLMTELDLSSGTLYPLLMRLAEVGCLETRWDVPERAGERPRHLYRLAPGAAPEVRALLGEWKRRTLPDFVPRPAT